MEACLDPFKTMMMINIILIEIIMLSLWSPWKVMLMNPRWNESREQRIVLQEATECVEVFELFLRYLYTGRLKVSHTTVLPILALADKYNVKVSSIC